MTLKMVMKNKGKESLKEITFKIYEQKGIGEKTD